MENVQSRRGLLALFGGLAAAAVVGVTISPAEASTLPASTPAAPATPLSAAEPDAQGWHRPGHRPRGRGWRRRWRRRPMRRVCRVRINRWGERVRVCRTW